MEGYSVQVDPLQSKGTYLLAENSWEFDGALTLFVGEMNICGVLNEGESLTYDEKTYSLQNLKGSLTLNIS